MIKDWKKIIWRYKGEYPIIFNKGTEQVSIDYSKKFNMFDVQTSKKYLGFKIRHFNSKKIALGYAKSYMRKH